jgi:ABC-2 type transport system permease protein
MSEFAPIKKMRRPGVIGFCQRTYAMAVKEFHQLRRDRVSCALIVLAPLAQTLLYGYAVNTTPRHLPTAILLQEDSDVERSILKALENTAFFDFTRQSESEREVDRLLETGAVKFAIEIPAGFERSLRRGEQPELLLMADATDPIATSAVLNAIDVVLQTALQHDHGIPVGAKAPFSIRVHARYNPALNNSFNIVPGLVGTILTMTLLVFTALSVTRETERNTMEGLLSRPIRPAEIMLGKIIPYIFAGLLQAAVIISIGVFLFGVPILGSLFSLAALSVLFIITNLSIGYFFSTIARNQLQAVQLCSMFILPNLLLSGFMFPIAGMPRWAQWITEILPLTYYLRVVRGIMLKGVELEALQVEALALTALMLVAMTIALLRFRKTLD